MSKLRAQLSYANVMATIAVFIALGGASYAALKLPKNSVGTKQLKKGAVSLDKIKRSAQTSLKGQQGEKGEQGLQGPKGDQGPGVLYGRAPAAENRTLLISLPAMGLEVRTHDVDAADPGYDVRIVNTNPADGTRFWVVTGGIISPIPAGGEEKFGGLAGVDALVVENGGSGRMVTLDCFANVLGAGDDGFMQCMAIRAGAG
jgi:hypothetical protein